ncbi:MAG: serine hydrolase domain-containing protein [Myxococcota bacterium]
MSEVKIEGVCQRGFEGVKEAFAREFEAGNELGAAVCITLEGTTVVDLWGGYKDEARTEPWERETLANVYSTTKGITAIAAHRLVDEGLLDLDAPVADYWPEFAAAGKERLPVRYLLSHQAGLAAIKKPLSPENLFDWTAMCTALAEQEPWWEPGTAHGYHAITFGWLVGELVRRIRGQKIGDVVRNEIAGPLGVDFEIGFGPELDDRVAPLVEGPIHPPADGSASADLVAEILNNPESLMAKAFANPPVIGLQNDRAWRAAEIPAANGHTNAHSLARIYGALANGGSIDGVELLSNDAIERARAEVVNGEDQVLPLDTRLALGFFLPVPTEPTGPNDRSFGHGGAGGSYSMADPENRLSFGYVMNLVHQGAWLVDPRPRRLIDAAYACM